MHKEFHSWHSPRLGVEMRMVVHGHYGPPILAFPTSGGDEGEMERMGLIGGIGDFIDAGRSKIYCVNSRNEAGFYNKGAHPFHRSYVQKQFDEYIRHEVVPFIHHHCGTAGIPIATMGASFGAYHAANTLFKHPDVIKRCFATSGIYDVRRFMDGMYDDNFYFNNPMDYLANLSDPWYYQQYASCDIHIATGHGPWEKSGPSYEFSALLARKGIAHHLDDFGPMGGHDWPYWTHQMRQYMEGLF
jgi:esterase/lipase superfamily enzyme